MNESGAVASIIAIDDITGKRLPAIKRGTRYSLRLPLSNIGITNDPINIASDYAWVLFAAELLYPHVVGLGHDHIVQGYSHSELLGFEARNVEGCRAALREIKLLFDEDLPDESEPIRSDAAEFESSLPECPRVCLPSLGDSFMANYVHALSSVYEDEDELEQAYERFPMWRHNFWRSFASHEVGADVFASEHSWIFPRQVPFARIFQQLDWDTAAGPTLSGATAIKVSHHPWMLLSESACVRIPETNLNAASECWHECLRNHATKPGDTIADQPDKQWHISDDGSVVCVAFETVRLLTFAPASWKIRPEQLKVQLKTAEDVCTLLAGHCGVPSTLNWSGLNPEMFEQLCCDVLFRCDRFDSRRLRKLGNARSRDGGRDIEVWTQPLLGGEAKKWIYQCKFSSGGMKSLAGSRVAAADTIDQFDADGFGVMTNAVIDATLYDKLDAIKNARAKRGLSLEIDTWAIHDFERFIHPKHDLKKKYFRDQTQPR